MQTTVAVLAFQDYQVSWVCLSNVDLKVHTYMHHNNEICQCVFKRS